MPILSALGEHVVEIACPKCGFVIEWSDPNITPTPFHFYEDVLVVVIQKWNDNDARVLALLSK